MAALIALGAVLIIVSNLGGVLAVISFISEEYKIAGIAVVASIIVFFLGVWAVAHGILNFSCTC